MCFEILKVEEGLWTFVRVEGIEPTNNASEASPPHAVIWRRISQGTHSADGSRFVERTLMVVATCRQQKGNVLDYLNSCFEPHLRGQKVPSLSLRYKLPTMHTAASSYLRHRTNGYLEATLMKGDFPLTSTRRHVWRPNRFR